MGRVSLRSFLGCGLLAIWAAFRLPRWIDTQPLVVHGTYYCLLLLMILFARCIWENVRQADPETRKSWTLFLPVGLCLLFVFAVPSQFRLFPDEPALISTSYSLYRHQNLLEIGEGSLADPLKSALPVRPALYPFLVSLLHTVFGYRVSHGFAINIAACVGTLWAILALGTALLDGFFGAAAVVLAASFPIFIFAQSSSQHDAVNLCLIALYLFQLRRFLVLPCLVRAELLLLLSAAASQARYESALLIFPTLLALALHRRRWAKEGVWPRLLLIPFLFAPAVWQRMAVGVAFLRTRGPSEILFSPRYAVSNFRALLAVFFRGHGFWLPTAPIIAWTAALGAVLLAVVFWKARQRVRWDWRTEYALLAGLGLALLLAVHLCYAESDARNGVRERYMLPYLPLVSLLAAYAFRRMAELPRMAGPVIVALIAVFAFHLRLAYRQPVYRGRVTEDYLARLLAKNSLLVTEYPTSYLVNGYEAVSWEYAAAHAESLRHELGARGLSDILVLQLFAPGSRPRENSFAPRTKLQELYTYSPTPVLSVRVSRVIPD